SRRDQLEHKRRKPALGAGFRSFVSALQGPAAKKSRRRPTLPHGFPCSTIGSEELNFRVRDGIGCGLLENTTGNLWIARPKRFEGEAGFSQSESRARISNVP